MNKKLGIIIGILAVVVIGFYISTDKRDDAMMKSEDDKKTLEENNVTNNDSTVMGDTKVTDSEMKKDEVVVRSGSYEVYGSEKVALASTDHKVVLFFRAVWCPTCIVLDKDIRANLSKIPSGLTILDVDYDNSTDLKKKYGVTYQHTFVQVDKDGNLIKKWSGSPTLVKLVAEVK